MPVKRSARKRKAAVKSAARLAGKRIDELEDDSPQSLKKCDADAACWKAPRNFAAFAATRRHREKSRPKQSPPSKAGQVEPAKQIRRDRADLKRPWQVWLARPRLSKHSRARF